MKLTEEHIEVLESLSPSAIHAILNASARLAKDPKAPHQVTISVRAHVHQEFPKMLYRGNDKKVVADEADESALKEKGFSTKPPAPQK